MHSLPDFIIIGAQKCGTTSLFAYLKQHSEIDLPEEKEIHYFDNKYDKGIEWYKSQFPDNSGKISGEATPYYLFHPHVKERIFKHCPNTKLIVMLRNSTDRAYSHFVMEKNRNNEPLLTFEDAIVAEPIRLEKEQNKINNDPKYCSKIHQRFSYLSRGKYYSQITEWLKYFPLERFLFIKSERFFMNPEKELHRVFYF
ncbi:MAG: sulfotransferase domain-containing protein, partial [Bacteroidota bacterium]|nr:sulfotransferase domain-containing protein [Bacteroidota bacterium]